MSMRRICALGLMGLLLARLGAHGTTVLQLDLASLSSRASRILLARCESTGNVLIDGVPCTQVEFEILEVVKGQGDGRQTVLFAGGELDGVRQWVAGMPTFEPGEEVVLFLSAPDSRGRSWPIGLSQGKVGVVRNAGGEAVVVRADGDVKRVAGPTSARPVAAPPSRQPLGLFLDQVRHLAGLMQGGPDAR